MKKTFKVVASVIWVIGVICLGIVTVNYVANENVIAKYEKDKYQINNLTALGMTEPYIIHYNNGNVYFAKRDYENAIKEYEKALSYNVPKERECDIRVNLALAMVTPLDIDGIETQKDVDEILDVLYDAVDVLCEKGCAGREEKGHDKEAQKLKEEIEKLIEELENVQQTGSASSGYDESESGSDDNTSSGSGKEDQLLEMSSSAMDDRYEQLGDIYSIDDFNFFDWDNDEPTW